MFKMATVTMMIMLIVLTILAARMVLPEGNLEPNCAKPLLLRSPELVDDQLVMSKMAALTMLMMSTKRKMAEKNLGTTLF